MRQFFMGILVFVFCLLNFIGCATIMEGAKGIAGLSTKSLEDARKNASTQTFKCDYQSCYNKTLEILKEMAAYVYVRDKKKNLIAIYVSTEDTTPVGLFFKEIDANNTQIEVSSPSTSAKEYIATKVFSKLVMALNPIKEEKEEEKK